MDRVGFWGGVLPRCCYIVKEHFNCQLTLKNKPVNLLTTMLFEFITIYFKLNCVNNSCIINSQFERWGVLLKH